MIEDGLYLVQNYYSCYGVYVSGGVVVDAPPIAKWMIGKEWKNVTRWIRSKRGGRYEAVKKSE